MKSSFSSCAAHSSYLSLPAGRVNLDFRGNRFLLRGPALRGVPACQEFRGALEVPGCCCGTCRWGSGSVTCWLESFVLQQQRRKRKRAVRGWVTAWWTSLFESGCLTLPETFPNGVQGKTHYLQFTSCSQTCLAMDRIMFCGAKSPCAQRGRSYHKDLWGILYLSYLRFITNSFLYFKILLLMAQEKATDSFSSFYHCCSCYLCRFSFNDHSCKDFLLLWFNWSTDVSHTVSADLM